MDVLYVHYSSLIKEQVLRPKRDTEPVLRVLYTLIWITFLRNIFQYSERLMGSTLRASAFKQVVKFLR